MRSLEYLTRSHALLDERIGELGRRRYLSLADHVLLRTLKKKKLALKDAIARAQREQSEGDER